MTSTDSPAAPILSPKDGPTSLPNELVDPILAWTVHRTAFASRWDPSAIAQPLNVLSRTLVPLATKAALIQSPHVDLDTATRLGDIPLLRFMLHWSNQPGGRPVNYTSSMLLATQTGRLDVLEWWMEESGLLVDWCDTCFVFACQHGQLHVLDWWHAHGVFSSRLSSESLRFSVSRLIIKCLWAACAAGQIPILDWFATHMPKDLEMVRYGSVVLASVVNKDGRGQVACLEWWFVKAAEGVVTRPPYSEVIRNAFKYKQIDVLEWCEQHPELKAPDTVTSGHNPYIDMDHVVEVRLQAWLHRLGIPFTANESQCWKASKTAASRGDLEALAWLKEHGYLVGSQQQLMVLAMPCATVPVLEWIQDQVDSTTSPRTTTVYDVDLSPFVAACHFGRLDVVTWLLSGGLELDEADMVLCFQQAGYYGHLALLDWLMEKMRQHRCMSDVGLLVPHASRIMVLLAANVHACPHAFGFATWCSTHLKTGADTLLLPIRSDHDGAYDLSAFVTQACLQQDAEQLTWWFKLNQQGQLKGHIKFGNAYRHLCTTVTTAAGANRDRCIAALQAWFDAGVPMNLMHCILLAGNHGNIPVLDWLYGTAKAPVAAFVAAFETVPLDDDVDWDGVNWASTRVADLVIPWWKYTFPQVRLSQISSWVLPFDSPISVHLAKWLLKVEYPDIDLALPYGFRDGGNVALLMYMNRDNQEFHSMLQNDMQDVLQIVSETVDDPAILDWLMTQSGIPVDIQDMFESLNLHALSMCTRMMEWWEAKYGVEFDTGYY